MCSLASAPCLATIRQICQHEPILHSDIVHMTINIIANDEYIVCCRVIIINFIMFIAITGKTSKTINNDNDLFLIYYTLRFDCQYIMYHVYKIHLMNAICCSTDAFTVS